jgi:predicted enzyme related to lactoylglutathione lyase
MSTATMNAPEVETIQAGTTSWLRRDAANWFEIPSTNFERAVSFYERLLGVTLRREGGEMALFPSAQTGVGGSVVCRDWHKPAAAGALIYLNADGILPEVVARTKALGGKVMVPVTPVPGGFGHIACIVDSEGNQIGLHAH